jgi:hypothetical protein
MKRVLSVMSGMLLAASTSWAQAPPAGPMGTAAGLKQTYGFLKMMVTQAAEKMPESEYAFKPTPEIRTYGQLWGHVANAHFFQCAGPRGVPNPNPAGTDFEKKTTKAEVVKALADSYAFCDPVFSSLTDESAAEMIQGGRGVLTSRAAALVGLLTHDSEMYGIGTVYLRLKGLVPPGTEMTQRGRGPGRGRE